LSHPLLYGSYDTATSSAQLTGVITRKAVGTLDEEVVVDDGPIDADPLSAKFSWMWPAVWPGSRAIGLAGRVGHGHHWCAVDTVPV
jgi:hypothetical protein